MLSFCQTGHDYAASPVTECPELSKSQFRVRLSHCLPLRVVDARMLAAIWVKTCGRPPNSPGRSDRHLRPMRITCGGRSDSGRV